MFFFYKNYSANMLINIINIWKLIFKYKLKSKKFKKIYNKNFDLLSKNDNNIIN